MNFDSLVGESVSALVHPPQHPSIGLDYLDVVTTEGRIIRFTTDIIDGERCGDTYITEHFSLVVTPAPLAAQGETRVDLRGTIAAVETFRCDEWLGPVDRTIASVGHDPRPLFDGKVGSAPPGSHAATVVCGVLLTTVAWKMLVRTDPFPATITFTLNNATILNWLDSQHEIGIDGANGNYR